MVLHTSAEIIVVAQEVRKDISVWFSSLTMCINTIIEPMDATSTRMPPLSIVISWEGTKCGIYSLSSAYVLRTILTSVSCLTATVLGHSSNAYSGAHLCRALCVRSPRTIVSVIRHLRLAQIVTAKVTCRACGCRQSWIPLKMLPRLIADCSSLHM